MSLTRTTLSGAVAAGADTVNVTSATGFAAGKTVRIDAEYVRVVSVDGTAVRVSRGQNGTQDVLHALLAPTIVGDPSDFPPKAAQPPSVSYGASGAIAIPDGASGEVIVILNKATAAAMTLADPGKGQDGLTLVIFSETAAAHTVTYTAGVYGDTTSSDVLTFAAKVGASCTLQAHNGLWGAIALTNVTAG